MTGPDSSVDDPSETDHSIAREFDWSEIRPSVALTRFIGVVTNSDPMTVEPLFDTVDPDALDALLRSADDASEFEVTFKHGEFPIRARSDGTVTAYPDTAGRTKLK